MRPRAIMVRSWYFYLGLVILSTVKCHVTKKIYETTEATVSKKPFNSDFKDISDSLEVIETTVRADSADLRELSDKEFIPESPLQSGKSSSKAPLSDKSFLAENRNAQKQKSSGNGYDPEKSVYLEDVVYSLKNQNWTKEEQPCLNSTLHLLRSLQNFTLWAVWDWDSISSQPQGLLFGNRYELGNFDECMNAPWAKTHPELQTQYCLADIVLEKADGAVKKRGDKPVQPYESAVDFVLRNKSNIYRALNEVTWGGCVPVSCGPRAVERLMATLLAHSHLGLAGMRARIAVNEPCQRPDQPREFDRLFYGFMILVAVLLVTASTCTYLNCTKKQGTMSIKDEIIQAFCLKTNVKNIMEMKKEGTEVLYGIRFLTIAFIVMDHQIGIFNSGPVINGLQVDQEALTFGALFVLHDDLFVDTFFVLSGFLVASAFMRMKDKKRLFSPTLFIVKRYLRLVICLAVVIFFYVAVFPYIGSGPLWNKAIKIETDPCKKNWWLNLLMLSNYVDDDNICIVISWYIPCDFHYFVATVLMFWLYRQKPRLALTCAGVIAVASVIAPGVINYIHDLEAIQLFTYEFVKNPRASKQFHVTYIKSHARLSAYIIGLFAGSIFAHYRGAGDEKRISKKRSILGAVAGIVIMTAVMMLGVTYLWRNYHPVEGAIYAALNRPLWAGGVSLLILCCCLGTVPYVEEFLSWYPWVPLSRLAYGLYLTHTALIMRNVYVLRSPMYNDYVTLLTSAFGVIVMGCFAALLIWLLTEAPLNNLFIVLVRSGARRKCPEEELQAAMENKNDFKKNHAMLASNQTVSTISNYHANLPTEIEISSKM